MSTSRRSAPTSAAESQDRPGLAHRSRSRSRYREASGGKCAGLPGATVELWQCDALGVYSGVSDARYGFKTQGETFLRGAQVTDARGAARFTTIYPGWYGGRAVHVHFKIRTQSSRSSAYEFTSQLFFPEDLTDQVHAQSPYSQKGRRDTTNERDGIFQRGGSSLVLQPTKNGAGYDAQFAMALDLADEAVGRSDAEGMRRGGPGRRGRSGLMVNDRVRHRTDLQGKPRRDRRAHDRPRAVSEEVLRGG